MNLFPVWLKNEKFIFEISDKKHRFEKLLQNLGLDEGRLVKMNQIHGNQVALVGRSDLGSRLARVDSMITAEPEVFLFATVADCFPVAFFDREVRMVGLAHAGWRGILSGVVSKTVLKMKENGANTRNIVAFLGPGARKCCYEFDHELAQQFAENFGDQVIRTEGSKTFLDLALSVIVSLQEIGVSVKDIFDSKICTIHNSDRYYSYRYEKTKKHNMAIVGYRS